MSHRRDSGSDAVHVIPTNDTPPENQFPNPGDSSVWATETLGSPSSSSSEIGKLFKTQLCCKFHAGNCPYVANSFHFAHSVEELRRPLPNRMVETREEFKIPVESGRSYNKGGHCNKYNSGEICPIGESCTFLHDEASRNRGSSAISLGPHGYGVSNGGNVAQTVKHINWESGICLKWEITGYCPFGANCSFAHGASELHSFGVGLIEGESKNKTSANLDTNQKGQAETVTNLVSPRVPPQRTSSTVMQNPNGVRTQRKSKWPTKLNRIYGDWIDDL